MIPAIILFFFIMNDGSFFIQDIVFIYSFLFLLCKFSFVFGSLSGYFLMIGNTEGLNFFVDWILW